MYKLSHGFLAQLISKNTNCVYNCFQIKLKLLEKNKKRWKKIANRHAEAMFCENETMMRPITNR
jgi:hypothetical protein